MSKDRYANGKIYKLVNECDDKIYVGSTCMPLAKRFYSHKDKAKKCPERHVYKHIINIGWENVKIVLIEKYPCNDNMELLKRERYWIDELNPALNKIKPTRTRKEYYETNKEKKKEYYETNKDNILEKQKEYYETNKDNILEKQKEYREANKDKIKERDSQPWTCDICKCNVRLDHKAKHCKTKKHLNNLNK